MTSNYKDLDTLLELGEKATPGPWEAQRPSWSRRAYVTKTAKTAITGPEGTVCNVLQKLEGAAPGNQEDYPEPNETAQFIASFRNTLPSIKALREAHRVSDEQNQELREKLKNTAEVLWAIRPLDDRNALEKQERITAENVSQEVLIYLGELSNPPEVNND